LSKSQSDRACLAAQKVQMLWQAVGADRVSDAKAAHMVAIDARAPLYDGGIATRVDCVSLGIVVNKDAERFYDEGEDFWPKRYALWGRFVAAQRGQTAFCLTDSKPVGRFMPPVFPGEQADSIAELAVKIGLDPIKLEATVAQFNAACSVTKGQGTFDHTVQDDCVTTGLTPAKTHWALPLDAPPYFGFALKPGVTFTYLGVKVDDQTRIHFGGQPSPNLFAAGEIMAGNVLGKGYLAGIGMAIGTAFGRIAGREAGQQATT
jgi:tricarballylate dehydrogenase